MIDKIKQIELVNSAKHSCLTLLKFVGGDSPCNLILLKWADVSDAILGDNEKLFMDSIAELICKPLKYIASALHDDKSEDYIGRVMEFYKENPKGTKKILVDTCNLKIEDLNKGGSNIELIKGDE